MGTYLLFMAITRSKKAELISALKEILAQSASIVFVHAKGLSVNNSNILRTKLHENQGGYKVVKKTLLKKVLVESGIPGTLPPLEGEIAIAFSNDLLVPAREVFEFSKNHKDSIQIVGGVFDGSLMSQVQMLEIATIPSLHTLRGMFVNVINSPIQGMVIALSQIAEKKS